MSDQENRPTTQHNPVETRVGGDRGMSIELGEQPADGKARPVTHNKPGVTAEFDGNDMEVHTSDENHGEVQEGAEGQEQGEPAGPQLPDFNASDAAVVQQYDAAYMNTDGSPNMEAFSQKWWGSSKRNPDGSVTGSLSDSDYAYLQTKGYSKEMVKDIERGQVALYQQKQATMYARAGGQQNMQTALQWARGGGYTPAQKAAYMSALGSSDPDVYTEAVDLLMTRYQNATGRTMNRPRSVSPQRSTDAAGGAPAQGGGEKGYANHAEYRADLRLAREKGDQNLLNQTRRRLKASPWYTGKK
jgi:hypothetical protein